MSIGQRNANADRFERTQKGIIAFLEDQRLIGAVREFLGTLTSR